MHCRVLDPGSSVETGVCFDGGHGNRVTGELDNGQHQQREDKAEHKK